MDDTGIARVAIVTGAGTGIGRATAIRLGSRGWSVAIGGRRQSMIDETAQLVQDAGGKALACQLDVCDPESVERFYQTVEADLGPVSALVNNAAMARYGPLSDYSPEEIAAEVNTKLLGSLYMSRRAATVMGDLDGPADIVFVTSVAAIVPWPEHLPYAAASAGAEHAARSLKLELEGTGIRVSIFRCGETAGTDFSTGEWGTERMNHAFGLWFRRGLLRHNGLMNPEVVAESLVGLLELPAGLQYELVQLVPTAAKRPLPESLEEWAAAYLVAPD